MWVTSPKIRENTQRIVRQGKRKQKLKVKTKKKGPTGTEVAAWPLSERRPRRRRRRRRGLLFDQDVVAMSNVSYVGPVKGVPKASVDITTAQVTDYVLCVSLISSLCREFCGLSPTPFSFAGHPVAVSSSSFHQSLLCARCSVRRFASSRWNAPQHTAGIRIVCHRRCGAKVLSPVHPIVLITCCHRPLCYT